MKREGADHFNYLAKQFFTQLSSTLRVSMRKACPMSVWKIGSLKAAVLLALAAGSLSARAADVVIVATVDQAQSHSGRLAGVQAPIGPSLIPPPR